MQGVTPAPVPLRDEPRRTRWGLLVLLVIGHLLALAGLARVFAPDLTLKAVEQAGSLVTVWVRTREPDPPPGPDAGAAGAAGDKAVPREVAAPKAPVPRPSTAPAAASTGAANQSGASEGQGTGAGGTGDGPGSGGSGTGQGSGARALEHVSGTIDNARDYPVPPGGREVRRGHDVVIELAVGTDGRVKSCRVTDPSPDPEADAITCRLAMQRFVFRPRLDASGQPATGIYRWRQRWF